MSVFSFPRINAKGLIRINVGTANNDDYSNVVFPDGPYQGQPLRLSNSPVVQPNSFGMDDADWVAWVQQPHPFAKPTPPSPADAITKAEAPAAVPLKDYLPAEWNYYGDMGLSMQGVKVLAVVHADGADPGDPLVGAQLSVKTGMLVDVNAEDVPCSQIFTDALVLAQGGTPVFTGKPSKAVTRWINFQRNAFLNGPNGAAGSFQCAVPLSALQGQPILDLLPAADGQGRPLAGIVCRYVMFRALQPINYFNHPDNDQWIAAMLGVYQTQGTNPDFAEITATVAPWFEGEMASVPTGRLLFPTANTVPLPTGSNGNGPAFNLAPAVFQVDAAAGRVSVDFSATFPEAYAGAPLYDPTQTGNNPKLDFGPVSLQLRSGDVTIDLGPVAYQDTAGGDARGWVFDLALPPRAAGLCETGSFYLHSDLHGDLLAEQEWLIASDQACLFAEQGSTGATTDRFQNEGVAPEPATVRVFCRGVEVTAAEGCPMTVWEYDTTPNQAPGPLTQVATGYQPGDPLTVTTDRPGNRLYTFTLPGQPDPPASYGDLNPMTAPMVNLRILPNEDYDAYYVDPSAPSPVGNAELTWDVLYAAVLRNYYLLYPAMSKVVPLNEESAWDNPQMAQTLYARVDITSWPTSQCMPRTRDLSSSRRRLIQAWCNRIIQGG